MASFSDRLAHAGDTLQGIGTTVSTVGNGIDALPGVNGNADGSFNLDTLGQTLQAIGGLFGSKSAPAGSTPPPAATGSALQPGFQLTPVMVAVGAALLLGLVVLLTAPRGRSR
jgi:hypothetical protein